MLNKLRNAYHKSQFLPSKYGFVFNPYFFTRRRLYQCILKNSHFLKGETLDFGCGSKPYRSLFKVEKYVGLDMQETGHSHVNENIDFFYDGKKIPFADNHFESIFTSEVFEHIFNLDEILKELHRVLKVNGHILITAPFVWDEHEAPYDFARYTSYGLKNLMERNGFKIISLEKTSSFIEVIAQLQALYISKFFYKKSFTKNLAQVFLIAPILFIGLILSKILPDIDTLYLNNVVVAKKVS
jgi:SAM-dependent methyltransferase